MKSWKNWHKLSGLILALAIATHAQTAPADTLAPATRDSLENITVTYTDRNYDHKQQVVVGGVIMLCVTLALVMMNNYNPHR